MLTTTETKIIPGSMTIELVYQAPETHRNRIVSIRYEGEDDDANKVSVLFDPDLFEGDEYPDLIEAVFTTKPSEETQDL